MTYEEIKNQGLKEFDEKYGAFDLCDIVSAGDRERLKLFLTTFAEKIREATLKETRDEVEDTDHKIETEVAGIAGILNGSAVGDTGQAHTAQMKLGKILKALDDLLAQLKK